jgi:hypothetical protein
MYLEALLGHASAAILVARRGDHTATRQVETGRTVTYLEHLHSYVYELKREAEARARALVTATALYVAAAGFIVKTASELHATAHSTLRVTTVLAIFAGLGGAVVSVLSLLLAIYVFWPRIADATSPMEPLLITATTASTLAWRHRRYSQDDIIIALSREIRAVSEVQIKRSKAVTRSAASFVIAVLCLLVAACLLLASFAIQ